MYLAFQSSTFLSEPTKVAMEMRSRTASGGQPCSGAILTAEKEGMYRLINVPMAIYRVDIHFYSFCAAAYSKRLLNVFKSFGIPG